MDLVALKKTEACPSKYKCFKYFFDPLPLGPMISPVSISVGQ